MVYPGLVNGHTHAAMGFFRGLGHGVDQMIQKLFFPVEQNLTASIIEALSLGYILSGLVAGVTYFADHYYFVAGVGKALDRLGLRGALGETIADLGGAHPSLESLTRAQKHVTSWPHSSRLTPVAAPHATDTVSLGLLQKTAQWARGEGLPIHMHLSQTALEFQTVQNRSQKTPVALALEAGLLTPQTLGVHLLHATPEDYRILSQSGASIGVCPASQILYETLTDLKALTAHQIPLVVGTDCAASNDQGEVLEELRTLGLLAKDRQCAPESYCPSSLWAMATHQPYRVFQPKLKIGAVEPGYLADLVFALIDPSFLPAPFPLTNLIYSHRSYAVRHVMVDGQWVLWNREPVKISAADLAATYLEGVQLIKERSGIFL